MAPVAACDKAPRAANRGAGRILAGVEYRKDPNFALTFGRGDGGCGHPFLDPRRTWTIPASYDRQAAKLVKMFGKTFEQYLPISTTTVKAASIG